MGQFPTFRILFTAYSQVYFKLSLNVSNEIFITIYNIPSTILVFLRTSVKAIARKENKWYTKKLYFNYDLYLTKEVNGKKIQSKCVAW